MLMGFGFEFNFWAGNHWRGLGCNTFRMCWLSKNLLLSGIHLCRWNDIFISNLKYILLSGFGYADNISLSVPSLLFMDRRVGKFPPSSHTARQRRWHFLHSRASAKCVWGREASKVHWIFVRKVSRHYSNRPMSMRVQRHVLGLPLKI